MFPAKFRKHSQEVSKVPERIQVVCFVHFAPLGEYAYVYVDGIYLKRSWGGEVQNVSVLVAIGVSADGYREIIGATEGMKEDFESWHNFFIWLKERGLQVSV